MQCRVFSGPWNQTQDAFNNWAKGKSLSKDVLIHTQANAVYKANEYSIYLTITVYYPESEPWINAADKWKKVVEGKHIEPTGAYEKAIAQ